MLLVGCQEGEIDLCRLDTRVTQNALKCVDSAAIPQVADGEKVAQIVEFEAREGVPTV